MSKSPTNRRESASSKSYTKGKRVRYKHRIRGPRSEVVTTKHEPECGMWSQSDCTCKP